MERAEGVTRQGVGGVRGTAGGGQQQSGLNGRQRDLALPKLSGPAGNRVSQS
jgi:hypothetical protein